MGGEVLELMDDKIERSRKEGIQEGIALGRQEGIELGRQEGFELGRQEGVTLGRQEGFERAESILAEQMAALGIDRALIDRMMADAAASLKDMPHQ